MGRATACRPTCRPLPERPRAHRQVVAGCRGSLRRRGRHRGAHRTRACPAGDEQVAPSAHITRNGTAVSGGCHLPPLARRACTVPPLSPRRPRRGRRRTTSRRARARAHDRRRTPACSARARMASSRRRAAPPRASLVQLARDPAGSGRPRDAIGGEGDIRGRPRRAGPWRRTTDIRGSSTTEHRLAPVATSDHPADAEARRRSWRPSRGLAPRPAQGRGAAFAARASAARAHRRRPLRPSRSFATASSARMRRARPVPARTAPDGRASRCWRAARALSSSLLRRLARFSASTRRPDSAARRRARRRTPGHWCHDGR